MTQQLSINFDGLIRTKAHRADTMRDKLLNLLRTQWVTPVDALNMAGCFSLSQRVGGFVRAGYDVQKQWVDLPSGKRVMSYRVTGSIHG